MPAPYYACTFDVLCQWPCVLVVMPVACLWLHLTMRSMPALLMFVPVAMCVCGHASGLSVPVH